MNAAYLVCDAHLYSAGGYNHTNGKDLIEIFSSIMPQFEQIFEKCRWRNVAKKCEELFFKYLTDDGVCYSFNTLNANEIFNPEGQVNLIFNIKSKLKNLFECYADS